MTIIKKHGRRSVFKITYWQLNPHLLLMIFLWSAGLEELGLSAWPRAGAARLCHLAFCNMIKKWLATQFSSECSHYTFTREPLLRCCGFSYFVLLKLEGSFIFLMQLNIILMEFLRNTTVSLGDVYISKKKIKLKVLDCATGSNEERCKLCYIILKSVFCVNFSSSCLTSLTDLTVREEIIFFYF